MLIPDLPQEAWRLLTKFLKCDFGFCHCVSPYFWNSGSITLLLVHAEPSESQPPGCGEAATVKYK